MVEDAWAVGGDYEPYVGRWSRHVASEFLRWVTAPAGLTWLDVGCGTGALSEAILDEAAAASVTGIDPSAGFADFAARRLADRPATFDVGDARELPYSRASFDVVVSGLVLNFVPDAALAIGEQHRVLRPGGMVAAYVWDYPGMAMMAHFWAAAEAVDGRTESLDESRRFAGWDRAGLAERFGAAGFESVETTEIVIPTVFRDFDDLWTPFLGGQGAAPSYLASVDDLTRDAIRAELRASVPTGPIELTARAWAVRAVRPTSG
ncbi:MAG: class I SAM-dependent methyltransferase [Pseudolysinimonas sp.]|uniref:class I SAM-dependent methyltransferase n=1 Tax=Pseudolysinimonas sp. TaxID=2680009 RepID=UPI0032658F8F